jgi:plasmid maintenance system antidote protein VapI
MLPEHRRPTQPGEMLLKELLEAAAVAQAEAAKRIGVSLKTAMVIAAATRWSGPRRM